MKMCFKCNEEYFENQKFIGIQINYTIYELRKPFSFSNVLIYGQ